MVDISFITSSTIKLNHAKYYFKDYNVQVSPQRNYGIGYIEPRIKNRENLHHDSLKDARLRWGKTISKAKDKLFFIEDTSVIIHALSETEEYPGVDIKYWMRENNFESVDAILKSAGNNRAVTVRSDIILYVPKKLFSLIDSDKYLKNQTTDGDGYITFTSSTVGTITEREYQINTNPLYPWLDNKTFNKWFVPSGCQQPISLLPIEEANRHDFRSGAFNLLVTFLYENKLIQKRTYLFKSNQNQFLGFCNEPLLLVTGLPCAGKTSLGMSLQFEAGYYHIEASDFMFLAYYQHHGSSSDVLIGDFAETALIENPTIVVDKILNHLTNIAKTPVIISGFRSPKELDAFIIKYNGPYDIKCIYVDTEQFTRYTRSLKRGRYDRVSDFSKFNDRDIQQNTMGLSHIKNDENVDIVTNDDSLNTYVAKIINKYRIHKTIRRDIATIDQRPRSLQDTILISMLLHENKLEYLTTTTIARLINSTFIDSILKTNKNNVSRYFNQNYHPFYEIRYCDKVHTYRLSETGISHALYILQLYSIKSKNNSDFYDMGQIYRSIVNKINGSPIQ